MDLAYPFHFDTRWRTAAAADHDGHVRDLIEQVLFTSPGERVNWPAFGSGLMQLVFMPNNDALISAVQFTVQGALQQWLSDLIQVEAVDVAAEDSAVRVTVQYVVLRTQQRQLAQFTRGAGTL